jgi:hypothetical protein
MLIRMLSRQQGSINGRDIETFEEGQDYDLPLSLARDIISAGWAVEVVADNQARDLPETIEIQTAPGPTETKPVSRKGRPRKGK